MYMIAFVTLVVALIGAYAQVWTLQTRNLYQQQTAMSDAMVTWHQTAVSVATTFTPPEVCSLTSSAPNGIAVCAKTIASGDLPGGYQTNPYTFYSITFKTAATPAHYYVLTYVPPPETPTLGVNLVCLPGGTSCTRLSASFTGFASQISKNPKISSYSYGTVSNTTACGSVSPPCLITPAIPLLAPVDGIVVPVPQSLVYPVPTLVSTNAIGIITEIVH